MNLDTTILVNKLSIDLFDCYIDAKSIRDDLRIVIDKTLNSSDEIQKLKEAWTSLDDAQRSIRKVVISLEALTNGDIE